jgi:hypothetical protein
VELDDPGARSPAELRAIIDRVQLFFWIEMRQLASMAISEVDRMVALDE